MVFCLSTRFEIFQFNSINLFTWLMKKKNLFWKLSYLVVRTVNCFDNSSKAFDCVCDLIMVKWQLNRLLLDLFTFFRCLLVTIIQLRWQTSLGYHSILAFCLKYFPTIFQCIACKVNIYLLIDKVFGNCSRYVNQNFLFNVFFFVNIFSYFQSQNYIIQEK